MDDVVMLHWACPAGQWDDFAGTTGGAVNPPTGFSRKAVTAAYDKI